MTEKKKRGLDTVALHAGYSPIPMDMTPFRSFVPPIIQSALYPLSDVDHYTRIVNGLEPGYDYGRNSNPTVDVLQKRLAALEGGEAALALPSGMHACFVVMRHLTKVGDEFITSHRIFGEAYELFFNKAPGWTAVTPRLVQNPDDLSEWERLITPKTRFLWVETPGNPTLFITDIAGVAELAHAHDLPLIVDNTVATPALIKPIQWGADIVVNSMTKYMGGHGNSLGGVIVDGGQFPWADHAEKFHMLNEPEPSYHGVVYTEALGPAAYIGRARTVPLRNTGSALSPMNAFLILQGLSTLPLRMERHCDNALRVATYLSEHSQVEWVNFAGLPDSPYYDLAQKYTGGKPSALLTFGIKGGFDAGVKFYDALDMFLRLVNIGDVKSLAAHPASTTHRQLTEEELVTAGVTPDMIRLCIGIEHIDDILADLEQALAASA